MSGFHKFNASNQLNTCLWCGRKLRRYRYREQEWAKPLNKQWGDYGDGYFCGQGCGYKFAVSIASMGHRLEPRDIKSLERIAEVPR